MSSLHFKRMQMEKGIIFGLCKSKLLEEFGRVALHKSRWYLAVPIADSQKVSTPLAMLLICRRSDDCKSYGICRSNSLEGSAPINHECKLSSLDVSK